MDLTLRLWRLLGAILGVLLWVLAWPRRRIVNTNLRLCFPDRGWAWHSQTSVQVFVRFAQSWLDRLWLWHAPLDTVKRRVTFRGNTHVLNAPAGKILLGAHFMGLDAAWTGLNAWYPNRVFIGMKTLSRRPRLDAWIDRGRTRFGKPLALLRHGTTRTIIQSLREEGILYLLPDMDLGTRAAVFVPFFGVTAACVTSPTRMAQSGHVPLIPIVTRMTPSGYEVTIGPEWSSIPSEDSTNDVKTYYAWLEQEINKDPAEYYWVHKRFKSRPEGEASLYG